MSVPSLKVIKWELMSSQMRAELRKHRHLAPTKIKLAGYLSCICSNVISELNMNFPKRRLIWPHSSRMPRLKNFWFWDTNQMRFPLVCKKMHSTRRLPSNFCLKQWKEAQFHSDTFRRKRRRLDWLIENRPNLCTKSKVHHLHQCSMHFVASSLYQGWITFW